MIKRLVVLGVLAGIGYIIIGVIAQDNGVPGGTATQQLVVSKQYGKPFALIGCGVTLHDPLRCDGIEDWP